LQGRGWADLLAVAVIIGAAQVVQGAQAARSAAVCGGADGAQVVRSAGVVIWCRWCRAAASSGRRVVLVCCWPSWSSSGRRKWCRVRRRRGIIWQAARVERVQGEKKKPRAAQVVRVSLLACVVGAGLLLIRQDCGGAVLPFAGGVRFSTLPGSALGVGLELSEL
jgi:hypothetical protein